MTTQQSPNQSALNQNTDDSTLAQSVDELTTRHEVGTYFQSARGRFEAFYIQNFPLREECQWEFVLDSTGKIAYEKAYDKSGKLVWGLVYSPPIEAQSTRLAHYVGPDGLPRPQINTTAEFVEFSYSPQGDESVVRYLDRKHQPQLDLDKVFGKRQRFDERGLVIESTFLDSQGQPMKNENGIATTKYIYDEYGNPIEQRYFDTVGNPILHKYKGYYHQLTYKYDERGNLTEEAYFDVANKPTLLKFQGYHQLSRKYDKRGNVIEKAYFDVAGKPTLNNSCYARFFNKPGAKAPG